MNYNLNTQIVAITGAAGNLGLSCARHFHSAGARLVLIDRQADRLPMLFSDLAGTQDALFSRPTDVTDPESIRQTIEEAVKHFGRIDAWINTAGGYRGGSPIHQTSISDWDFLLNLNARSVFVTCQAVLPQMISQKEGRIINLASRAALTGEANHSAYSVSKTAVVRLTETIAAEMKDLGITANCVLPGMIDTPQNRAAMPDADFTRWVSPESIAEVILFLASSGARSINGAAIPVFGRG